MTVPGGQSTLSGMDDTWREELETEVIILEEEADKAAELEEEERREGLGV